MSRAGGADRTILLVEDSVAVRSAFTILLEESGYGVTAAGTGADALRAAAERPPDLVLLDLGLPDMPGLELVRTLKADPETASVPLVALTGRDEETDRNACLSAGCVAYLVKPVETRELVRLIPEFMGG